MKKILSVLLAVMMLFGALSVGASAAGIDPNKYYELGIVNSDQIILCFDLNGGTMKYPQQVYNDQTGMFEQQSEVTGIYYMLPQSPEAHKAGTNLPLPDVVPPSGYSFAGWEYYDAYGNRQQPGAYAPFYFQDWMLTGNNYGIVYLRATFTTAEPEEDTLATVMNILIKIFGAIIGIVLYGGDTEMGVALMSKVLGGLGI